MSAICRVADVHGLSSVGRGRRRGARPEARGSCRVDAALDPHAAVAPTWVNSTPNWAARGLAHHACRRAATGRRPSAGRRRSCRSSPTRSGLRSRCSMPLRSGSGPCGVGTPRRAGRASTLEGRPGSARPCAPARASGACSRSSHLRPGGQAQDRRWPPPPAARPPRGRSRRGPGHHERRARGGVLAQGRHQRGRARAGRGPRPRCRARAPPPAAAPPPASSGTCRSTSSRQSRVRPSSASRSRLASR